VHGIQNAEPSSAALPFERRSAPRWESHTQVTALELSGERFGQIHELAVDNASHGGLAATSPIAIQPGTSVTLGFSQPGQLARQGVIRRCDPCGEGYRVAIQLQLGLAA
jgi:hypothetical protein